MATLSELLARRETLAKARAEGIRSTRYADGTEVEFKSDSEMRTALDDLDRQIAETSAPRRTPTAFRFTTSKGY